MRRSRETILVELERNDIKIEHLIKDQTSFGFGQVYSGRKAQEEVAVKIVTNLEASASQEIMKEISYFRQQCIHPNIVKFIGTLLLDQTLWVVMELCLCSARDLLQSMELPFNEEQISFICRESLKGLKLLHNAKKSYKYMKSSKILFTEKGEVKLGDAITLSTLASYNKRNSNNLLPYYLSPEQITSSHEVNKQEDKCDIWSLGITLIELAEGVPPHFHVHPMRVALLIARGAPPTLANKKLWSTSFHDFLKLCLFTDPNQRPDVKELLKHKFVNQVFKSNPLLGIIEKYNLMTSLQFKEEDLEDITPPESESNSSVHTPAQSLKKTEVVMIPASVEDKNKNKAKRKSQKLGKDSKVIELRNQLENIIKKDPTIQVPWLQLNYIKPNVLLTDYPSFNDGYSEEIMTGTLKNLVNVLNYHKYRRDNIPLENHETSHNAKIISDINTTLKTITRL